jgi:hypothetical protein
MDRIEELNMHYSEPNTIDLSELKRTFIDSVKKEISSYLENELYQLMRIYIDASKEEVLLHIDNEIKRLSDHVQNRFNYLDDDGEPNL